VGGPETKFYQSLTSLYVTGERVSYSQPTASIYSTLLLSFTNVFTCLTAKTLCFIRFVTTYDDTHPLFFSPSLSIYLFFLYISNVTEAEREREGEEKKDKCMHITVGLVRVELKISTFLLFSPIERIYKKTYVGVMTTTNIPYG
jgi:hypothetical protein